MDIKKVQEAYRKVILEDKEQQLNEANEEIQLARAFEKIFGVKVKKVDVKKTIEIHHKGLVDADEFENYQKVNDFEELVNKKFKNVKIDWEHLTYVKIEEY